MHIECKPVADPGGAKETPLVTKIFVNSSFFLFFLCIQQKVGVAKKC